VSCISWYASHKHLTLTQCRASSLTPALTPTLTCRNNRAPFTLVLNLIVPGPPWRNLVMSWAADYSPSSSSGSGTHSRGQTPKGSVAGRCGATLSGSYLEGSSHS